MKKGNLTSFVIIMGIMFAVCALLLAVISGIVWKFDLNAGAVSICVIVIYIISNFTGGFAIGKKMGKHKFLWGSLIGAVFFAVIFIAGKFLYPDAQSQDYEYISSAMICIISGMFGGMLAP